mgnify:CR=1 FL=1
MRNWDKVKTYSIKKRLSKVKSGDFASIPVKGKSFKGFYTSLPNILKAADIRQVSQAVIKAYHKKRAVIFMCGAHVIKCGLNPVINELIRRKIITCLCINGAGLIHDFELAFLGKTSEDVAASLKNGSFGMGRETAEFINLAVKDGVNKGLGLGESVSNKIYSAKLPFKKLSLLSQAEESHIPVCVFVAIGTDIIHQHPSFDAAAAGLGSSRDFRKLSMEIARLNNGGVVLNFGSAVIMPEVFLKALNLCRNLGNRVENFTSANFDMIYHYRPQQNIVARPTQSSGKGHYIIGHHEIMLPMLAQAIIEGI